MRCLSFCELCLALGEYLDEKPIGHTKSQLPDLFDARMKIKKSSVRSLFEKTKGSGNS